MHEIMNRKFYLGPKFGTLFNKKWITISELLHQAKKEGKERDVDVKDIKCKG
jgi:hypothetical protein